MQKANVACNSSGLQNTFLILRSHVTSIAEFLYGYKAFRCTNLLILQISFIWPEDSRGFRLFKASQSLCNVGGRFTECQVHHGLWSLVL